MTDRHELALQEIWENGRQRSLPRGLLVDGTAVGMETEPRVRRPSIAEIVAAVLRRRILDGELGDGELLSPQGQLLEEFGVSRPSLREAFWILQSEGLLTVRRGKHGGAVVHTPKPQGASKMLGMVLEAERVSVSDLAEAIDRLEPMFARECARRSAEDERIAKDLEHLVEESRGLIYDRLAFLESCHRFHDAIVRLAGNRTLSLVAGALIELWSGQQLERGGVVDGAFSEQRRQAAVREHAEIVDAIRHGREEQTARLLRTHLETTREMLLPPEDASPRFVVIGHQDVTFSELHHDTRRAATRRF